MIGDRIGAIAGGVLGKVAGHLGLVEPPLDLMIDELHKGIVLKN
jgi:hypothetical protein